MHRLPTHGWVGTGDTWHGHCYPRPFLLPGQPRFGIAPGVWAVLRWEVALPGSGLGCWSLLPGWTRLCWSLRSAQCSLPSVSLQLSQWDFQWGFFQSASGSSVNGCQGNVMGFVFPILLSISANLNTNVCRASSSSPSTGRLGKGWSCFGL